jgi:prepilin-type N-terminal cleavage/methylation domain-containing protein/prepilin-type processing-associated H-X9-DG protein
MKRNAFTLIELMVVMAIMTLLIGLLLSAVQSIRARAARLECQNRMRQCTLALQSYHDRERHFPTGHDHNGGFPHTGWQFRILSDIGQEPLDHQAQAQFIYEYFTQQTIVSLHAAARTVVQTYTCPADARTAVPQTVRIPTYREPFTAAMGSFLGVSGQNWTSHDGILYHGSKTRMTMITDGTSQTLLLGERPPARDFTIGWWFCRAIYATDEPGDLVLGVREPVFNSDNLTFRICGRGPLPFQARRFDDVCSPYQYWSPHSGGAHFSFADGSVRFLSYSADEVLPALASRAGNESVEVP